MRFGVRRALIIVLSRHAPGDTVCYSEIIPVQQALGISAGRVAEVLQEMGVLADDRRPSFESWLNQMSANGTGPVSTIYFAKTALRGQAATLERLRVDRQLTAAEEQDPASGEPKDPVSP